MAKKTPKKGKQLSSGKTLGNVTNLRGILDQ